ncbi:MAG: hypothetical protein ABJA34_00970 [Pseudonocardiales bacterium]
MQDLVGRVRPTPAQRVELLSPMLDFASDASANCSTRPSLGGGLAHEAWLTAFGDSPAPALTRSSLSRQIQAPQLMTELFKGAHSPCDVVGNGVIIGLERWGGGQLPNLLELSLSAAVGFGCSNLLEKLH